jgi:hypothetical protein
MTCRSTGKPDPYTLWYKVGIQMANLSKHLYCIFHYSMFVSVEDFMQSPAPCTSWKWLKDVAVKVLTAMTVESIVFWIIMP